MFAVMVAIATAQCVWQLKHFGLLQKSFKKILRFSIRVLFFVFFLRKGFIKAFQVLVFSG